MTTKATRVLVAAGVVAAGLAGSIPTHAVVQTQGPRPQVCDDPTDSVTLFAEPKGKRRYGYGLTPDSASIPGPTITMTEGDCLSVTLVNDTDRRLSIHPHGVDYTVASDGTPLNDGCVKPGKSRSYVWQAHVASTRPDGSVAAGTAGYWHYHDHCMGGQHGTKGIRSGLFAALIVRRAGDLLPDNQPCVLVMSAMTFNLKKAPHTPTCEAALGEREEFVVIGHGELFHTFHLHGHRWADTRSGYLSSEDDSARVIDNKTIGPADSFGFQVIAGEGVGAGAWMYHCHVQGHSDAGMSGIFLVTQPDGSLTPRTKEVMRAWRHHSSHHGGEVHGHG